MTYEEAEEYINSIPRFAKEKSASGLRQILDRFGNPQDSFSYIHVAGTNGKGSVCAFLDSMLRRAGRRTGLFTSPHLVTTAERMKVDGEMISRGEFTEIFLHLRESLILSAEAYHLPQEEDFLRRRNIRFCSKARQGRQAQEREDPHRLSGPHIS